MSDIVMILQHEEVLLNDLLSLLEIQHRAIVKNDMETMESIVDKLIEMGKEIEKAENKRKSLPGGNSIREAAFNNKELDNEIRNIRKIVSELNVQKKTNDLLLRQGINFNDKVINILSQKRSSVVYGNNGKLAR
ncbi:MAG: flagellar protein FlgN [Bacillota bacterium]|nr:flagellar protein FlgN [Bacillota bacterium]